MSRPDPIASSALSQQIIKPVYLIYADFLNEPLRACTAGQNLTISGSGVMDLDGVYDGLSADVIDISELTISEGGNDSLTITLSGLIDLDNDILNEIGNRANWQGRKIRLWRMIRNADNIQQGGWQNYYLGKMSKIRISSRADSQVIILTVEGFLGYHTAPSNRGYQNQERYNPNDLSGRATPPIANGISGNPIVNNTQVGTAGALGGGGARGSDLGSFGFSRH